MKIKIEVSIDNQEVVELLEYIVDALEDIADGYAREQSETEGDEVP